MPLVMHLLETGQRREADAIVARLDAAPGFHVEAAIAHGIRIALTDGFDLACLHLTEKLTGADVDHTHFRWCAEFLAKNGHLNAGGLDLLELERSRFPGPVQKAREQIALKYKDREGTAATARERVPPPHGDCQGH